MKSKEEDRKPKAQNLRSSLRHDALAPLLPSSRGCKGGTGGLMAAQKYWRWQCWLGREDVRVTWEQSCTQLLAEFLSCQLKISQRYLFYFRISSSTFSISRLLHAQLTRVHGTITLSLSCDDQTATILYDGNIRPRSYCLYPRCHRSCLQG